MQALVCCFGGEREREREREREKILVALEEICEVKTSFYFGKNTILVPTFWGHS